MSLEDESIFIETCYRGFRKSSGPFPVGCIDILNKTGVDSTLCRVYYPTEKFTPSEDICPPWMSDPEYETGFSKFMKTSDRMFFKYYRVPVYRQGPLVMPEGKEKLPLVLFSHGLGGNMSLYNYIAYEIASNGFIVAALEHRDKSASMTYYLETGEDKNYKKVWLQYQTTVVRSSEEKKLRNSQVHARAKEMSKLMDTMESLNKGNLTNILLDEGVGIMEQFQGKIDVEKCAVMGHAFGGATAITSLAKDNRLKLGIALDIWMLPLDDSIYKSKIEKPLLFINTELFQWRANVAGIRKLDCDITGISSERKMITLLGTDHYTQCDHPFYLGAGRIRKSFLVATTDLRYTNNVNMKLILCFLGKHLGLNCAGEVDEIVAENSSRVMLGTNLELDEERIEKSKAALKRRSLVRKLSLIQINS